MVQAAVSKISNPKAVSPDKVVAFYHALKCKSTQAFKLFKANFDGVTALSTLKKKNSMNRGAPIIDYSFDAIHVLKINF